MTALINGTTVATLSDEQLVASVLQGKKVLFELLMRRHNLRVFRACRAILRDDAEAEDVAQEAYVKAYEHLGQFEARARFSTWLTRIAVNEAFARVRRRKRNEEIDAMEDSHKSAVKQLWSGSRDPEQNASSAEARSLLEHSIDALPDLYREVFVLRDVDEMSTSKLLKCWQSRSKTLRLACTAHVPCSDENSMHVREQPAHRLSNSWVHDVTGS
jgi:RNA polymerase sigma-70 factor, ECF subfamily